MKTLADTVQPYVNTTEKWIFIHIPKTGGTCVSRALGIVGGHCTFQQVLQSGVNPSEFYKFCFCRNPFTRALSFYHHVHAIQTHAPWVDKVRSYPTFDTFMSEFVGSGEVNAVTDPWVRHLDTQFSWVQWGNSLLMDCVGRAEDLRGSLTTILQRIGRPVPQAVMPVNQSPRYAKRMSQNSMDVLQKRYAVDFHRFGYGAHPDEACVEITG